MAENPTGHPTNPRCFPRHPDLNPLSAEQPLEMDAQDALGNLPCLEVVTDGPVAQMDFPDGFLPAVEHAIFVA